MQPPQPYLCTARKRPKKRLTLSLRGYIMQTPNIWKHSPAGRALPLQGRCHRFEPCCFHHAKQSYAIRRIVFLCALNSLCLRKMGYAHKKETCVARVRLCRVVRMPLGRDRADFGRAKRAEILHCWAFRKRQVSHL